MFIDQVDTLLFERLQRGQAHNAQTFTEFGVRIDRQPNRPCPRAGHIGIAVLNVDKRIDRLARGIDDQDHTARRAVPSRAQRPRQRDPRQIARQQQITLQLRPTCRFVGQQVVQILGDQLFDIANFTVDLIVDDLAFIDLQRRHTATDRLGRDDNARRDIAIVAVLALDPVPDLAQTAQGHVRSDEIFQDIVKVRCFVDRRACEIDPVQPKFQGGVRLNGLGFFFGVGSWNAVGI